MRVLLRRSPILWIVERELQKPVNQIIWTIDLKEKNWRLFRSSHSPTPVDAIAKLVLTYARKVLSDARWSLATLPAFSSIRLGECIFGRCFHKGGFGWDGEWGSGVEDMEEVVWFISEAHDIDESNICSWGDGGGAGACRDKGGGLKDDSRFAPNIQLILGLGDLELSLDSRGEASVGRSGETSLTTSEFERTEYPRSWSVILTSCVEALDLNTVLDLFLWPASVVTVVNRHVDPSTCLLNFVITLADVVI